MWLETNKTVIEGQFYLHFDQHGQVSPVLTHFLSRNSPKHPFLCSFKTEALDSNFFDFRQMKQVLTKLLSSMLCPHAVATPKQEIWSFWNFGLSPAGCLALTVPLKWCKPNFPLGWCLRNDFTSKKSCLNKFVGILPSPGAIEIPFFLWYLICYLPTRWH